MGSLFGGKTNAEAQRTQQFDAQFQPLIQQQTAASQYAMGQAQPLLGRASSAIEGPLSFWTTLLNGDRGAMSSLLGPELDGISERDSVARRAISQFGPRGSGMSARLGELGEGTARDINTAFLNLRPQAADQVGNLAQLLFGVGTNLFNASTGTSGNTLQSLLGRESANQQDRALRQQGNGNIFRAANFLWGGVG